MVQGEYLVWGLLIGAACNSPATHSGAIEEGSNRFQKNVRQPTDAGGGEPVAVDAQTSNGTQTVVVTAPTLLPPVETAPETVNSILDRDLYGASAVAAITCTSKASYYVDTPERIDTSYQIVTVQSLYGQAPTLVFTLGGAIGSDVVIDAEEAQLPLNVTLLAFIEQSSYGPTVSWPELMPTATTALIGTQEVSLDYVSTYVANRKLGGQ